MKRKLLVVSTLLILCGLIFAPVQGATNELPLTPEFWFQTSTLNAYSEDYSLQDYLIGSDGKIDMSFIAGLTAEKDYASVNFANGATIVESDPYFDDNIISTTFLNNTFNAGVYDAAKVQSIETEFSTASKSTIGTGAAKTNDTSGNVYWLSDYYWDSNNDGDYADPTDKSHYPLIDTSATFFFSGRYHINASDATAYGEIAFTFATTGSDYTIRVRYWQKAGTTGWTDLDSTGENAATLNYYDANYTSISGFLPVNEIIDGDAGDSPDLQGLKSGKITVFGGADKLHTISVYNMAVLTQKPALSDRSDEDKDFDIDATAVFSTFIWDDTDFLATKVTEGATESYDNTMPLSFDLETGFTPLVKFRKLQITGEFSCPPTTFTKGSVVSGSYYKTYLDMKFLTTGLNDFVGTATDYFSWTNVQFNVTLNDEDLPGTYQTFEDQLVVFKAAGLDQKSVFDDAWDVTSDDTEVSYDFPDPSTTTGAEQTCYMEFYTRKATPSGTGGAGVTTTDDTLILIVIVIVVVIALGGSSLFLLKRKKDKGSFF